MRISENTETEGWLHARRARQLHEAVGLGVHGYLPSLQAKRRESLHLLDVSKECESKRHRLETRLLRRKQLFGASREGKLHPQIHHGL